FTGNRSIIIVIANAQILSLIIGIQGIEVFIFSCQEMIDDQPACSLSHNAPASVIDLFHNAAVFLIYKDSFRVCQIIGSFSHSTELSPVLISEINGSCLLSCLGVIKNQVLILISKDSQSIAVDIRHFI